MVNVKEERPLVHVFRIVATKPIPNNSQQKEALCSISFLTESSCYPQ